MDKTFLQLISWFIFQFSSFYFVFSHLLEMKLPYDPICPSVVGRLVCWSFFHNILKGREVSFPISYWITCFYINQFEAPMISSFPYHHQLYLANCFSNFDDFPVSNNQCASLLYSMCCWRCRRSWQTRCCSAGSKSAGFSPCTCTTISSSTRTSGAMSV